MDGFRDGGTLPAAQDDARRAQHWGEPARAAVTARVAAGESLRSICSDPAAPGLTTVKRWIERRPAFAAEFAAAREAAGGAFLGRGSSYCEATAEAICARLAGGEAMVRICADADMPVVSTVYKWMDERDDFRRAVIAARRIQADTLAATGWEMALAAQPDTARLAEVQLRQLRWYAGKLSPRVYGPSKAVANWEAEGEADPQAAERETAPKIMNVSVKSFWVETGPQGQTRVRARWYAPGKGKIEEDVPGDWTSPPGEVAWIAQQEAEQAARSAAARAARAGQPPPDDPEGWL